ncbi:MAG: isocitrate/isopropylmalate dehydrogenase family protein [Clostridiales bacterium]|uniref:isocitrate/isopropylmalate dehydrogenase family protein n=1 Tax=Aminipila sp. TaxID=2060095 RepID=UPI001DDB7BAA|nr:isocitrate/isopropylmalate family dehydrogenase [Aminipila sp.]MBE6033739.1 isocitrate/isopropylmalate dehydrogenase family protein [Clostridiales bacterium]
MIKIAVLPGNGVGPVVTECGVQLLKFILDKEYSAYRMDWLKLDTDTYLSVDEDKVRETLDKCSEYDFILFGAVGCSDKRKNNYGGGLLLDIRRHFDLYINLRPVAHISDRLSPLKKNPDFDIAIVRENTECAYVNIGGRFQTKDYAEIAVQEMIYTGHKTEKTINYAFELSTSRKNKVTLCDKSNVLKYGHGLWKDIFYEVAKKYPQVTAEHYYVDSLAAQLVKSPESFDVIVAPNMFGDILSDLTAQLQGGIATAGSINKGDGKTIFVEPVHGSADDLTDKEYANPIGMINAVRLMLEELNLTHISGQIKNILTELIRENEVTPDLGGSLTAAGFMDKLINKLTTLDR